MHAGRQWFGLILLTSLIAAFVIGCGGSPDPTATPIPTIAPTAVPATQASSSASGGTLADALGKAKEATTYKVNMSITGQGQFASDPSATPEAGAEDKPVTLVQMQGEVDGKNAHFTLQGELTSFLGIDPSKTFEVISYDGISYLKGPVPLLGANEDAWYQAPPEAASVAQPPLTPGSFLESFGESGLDPATFKEAGAESLDGQNCQVFAGDKAAVVDAFNKLGGATGATQEDLDSIENAEFKFWVCPDGYLHQVKMLIEGHEKDKPDQKGSFQILMKISEFNGNVTITPPSDALPLKLPQLSGTPTATP